MYPYARTIIYCSCETFIFIPVSRQINLKYATLCLQDIIITRIQHGEEGIHLLLSQKI